MGLKEVCEGQPSTLGVMGICFSHHVPWLSEMMLPFAIYCLCNLALWFASAAWRGARNPKSLHFLTVLVLGSFMLLHMIPGHLVTAWFNYYQDPETSAWYDNYIYHRPLAPRGGAGDQFASWPPPPRTAGQHMLVQTLVEIAALICLLRGHGEMGGLLAVLDAGNGTCIHLYYYGGTLLERAVDCYPTHAFVVAISLAVALTAPPRGKSQKDTSLRVRLILLAFAVGAVLTVISFAALGRKPVVRGRLGGAAGVGWPGWAEQAKEAKADL